MTKETIAAEKTGFLKRLNPLLMTLLLLFVLAAGAYLRFTGLDWDEDQHLHPDERFLTMVSTSIHSIGTPADQLGAAPSVDSQPWRQGYQEILPDCQQWGSYFDTACSPLNPNNRGYDFYVYGTLPLFVTRYVGEWVEQTGYSDIHLVGRALSAVVDLLTVLLVFLAADRLYNRWVGVLAAAFAAVAVLPIQQSHFYTVDTFASLFMMLAFYVAAVIATSRKPEDSADTRDPSPVVTDELTTVDDSRTTDHDRLPGNETGNQLATTPDRQSSSLALLGSGVTRFFRHPLFWTSIIFGLALGMAVASKINAAPIAVILPLAAGLYLLKLSPEEQRRQTPQVFVFLVLGAIASFVAFRIFQPYAFTGPGFFGIKPNQAWIDDLQALRAQTGGDVDFPPALQWARRPLTFSWQNMVLWGLGLPLGILAWTGFALMAWRMFKGQWQKHILLWGWTAAYFGWQSLQWNSTMRYQLPIYPLLAIIAAWFVVSLYERKIETENQRRIWRWLAVVAGALVLIATSVWAYAFMGIYPRDHTRIEASRWLFQEMPGPITLSIEQGDGIYFQPLTFHEGTQISREQPYEMGFEAYESGQLSQIQLPHVVDLKSVSTPTTLFVEVSYVVGDNSPVASGHLVVDGESDGSAHQVFVPLDGPMPMNAGEAYYITLDVNGGESEIQLCVPATLQFQPGDGREERDIYLPQECLSRYDLPVTLSYAPQENGNLKAVALQFGESFESYESGQQTLRVDLYADLQTDPLTGGLIQSDFSPDPQGDARGMAYQIYLDPPVALEQGQRYYLRFRLENGPGTLAFSGATAANESSWDDGLPLRIDGYDPYGGIYRSGLNFEMYWDDNEEKYERFVTTLDQADYVLISSSRQWGTTSRVPERYPLTSEYYRHLIGCPAEKTIEWCFTVANEDTFQGDLGFDLAKIFVSNPSVGTIEINDQFSEEAFTVYDHPKVFVFKKSDDYNPEQVREILGAVDLSKVIRITPKQADSHPGNLMLPPDRLAEQRSGGTWSDLFDYESFQNKYPLVTIVLWYLAVSVLGWLIYPFVRFALPGLADRGYPLVRVAGLVLLTYLAWLAGSVQIPFSRATIGIAFLLVALLGGTLAYHQRAELRIEWHEKRKYFLTVELLTLAFFIFGLLVRFGNPDLWHPWKGGEKPMDFSYFNAVIKSTSFPPYDPWFAGGYINYYYYGFVIVGVLVKLLGIVPSIAYNLILPTLFAMIAMGAFSTGWNLIAGRRSQVAGYESQAGETPSQPNDDAMSQPVAESTIDPYSPPLASDISATSARFKTPFFTGLMAAFFMAVLGNLGTLRMILDGFKIMAAPTGDLAAAGVFNRVLWTVKGFFMKLLGSPLPYRMDEWYWNPSRAIGGEHGGPITEFPYFTFLYGDLHAHLIALPLALLAIAWALSIVLSRAWKVDNRRSIWQIGISLFLGGLVIGALYPVNLSDIYTYLPLGIVALAYAIWRYVDAQEGQTRNLRRAFFLVGSVSVLTFLTLFLYQPYSQWYGQGYSEIQLWRGTRTPVGDYLTHWGAFIFIFLSWMIYESIDWMASTPVSALRKLRPYRGLILGSLIAILGVILVLGINLYPEGVPFEEKLPLGLGVHVIWFVMPMAVWTAVLLLRPGISDARRFALFLLGTGLVLTLMVEIVVVSGDIGRMNTVFKFYLHGWTLFAISAAAAITWMWQSRSLWNLGWRIVWQVGLVFFVASMALYPLTATLAKVRDRMATEAPHTLDGMTYMQYATLFDLDTEMDLSQDYDAIRWLQDHISGSPVIVEGQLTEYRWGTRFTIYTGLPGVVGWNWHQRQQRTLLPDNWVWDRVNGVDEFYQTIDLDAAVQFLNQYDVSYIILGQLERAKYVGDGLVKFEEQNGRLWNEIYRNQDTVIYEVIRE